MLSGNTALNMAFVARHGERIHCNTVIMHPRRQEINKIEATIVALQSETLLFHTSAHFDRTID